MRSIKVLLSVFILLLFLAGSAFSEDTVRITLFDINFGNYDPSQSRPSDSVGSMMLQYDATKILNAIVIIDAGVNAGSPNAFQRRALKSGSDLLQYNLYIDPGCTKIWGDGTNNSFTQVGQSSRLTVYARIPPRQYVRAGVYTDRVTVTVKW